MDALCALLQTHRATDAFLLRSSMSPPWSLRIEDEAPLTIVAVVRGHAVLVDESGEVTQLEAGDAALVRGPTPYVVADHEDTPPQVVIKPGQVCVAVDGAATMGPLAPLARTWGNALDGETLLLTGTYERTSHLSDRMLRALPTLAVVRRDEWEHPFIDLLASEMVRDVPGQSAMLDRLLDVLCLAAVRAALTRPDASPPPWFTATADPVVGPALELIHNNPSAPWSVAGLASEVGASRAAFARRFTELVGEPPLAYLTGWRIDVAADDLRDSDATVAAVANRVGYANPYAFSNAFKRHTGVSPSAYRLEERQR